MHLSCNRKILKEELSFGYFFVLAWVTIAKQRNYAQYKNKAELKIFFAKHNMRLLTFWIFDAGGHFLQQNNKS